MVIPKPPRLIVRTGAAGPRLMSFSERENVILVEKSLLDSSDERLAAIKIFEKTKNILQRSLVVGLESI